LFGSGQNFLEKTHQVSEEEMFWFNGKGVKMYDLAIELLAIVIAVGILWLYLEWRIRKRS